jgi:hypothetical protein
VRTGPDLDVLAGSAKHGVAGDVGDSGDHIEAVVEGDGQAGTKSEADLLLDVE